LKDFRITAQARNGNRWDTCDVPADTFLIATLEKPQTNYRWTRKSNTSTNDVNWRQFRCVGLARSQLRPDAVYYGLKGGNEMPDMDEMKAAKQFYTDIPQKTGGFFLKGSDSLDWGMKNRLARIFNPESGRTVMLAIDHGYFQGPTTGLERIDLNILPLVPYADTLMLTRGILRSIVPPSTTQSIVLRVSGGTSILKELSNEQIAVDIEESIRLNVCAMAVQVFIGGAYERQSIMNMTRMVDLGTRYGIPTLAVTAVGKDMARDARYFRLATRICAELGAQYIKSYYIDEGFETVTASCPVPIVMAGGKKIPELDALKMAYNAVQQGASGVDMGRNIFQSESPTAMIQAVSAVVHKNETPEKAFDLYNTLKGQKS
jgi:putative autoinducer-2 (AI-2) aldolase